MFSFDNESFRCLCAWREGVNFTTNELADFNSSWKITVNETFRFVLFYFIVIFENFRLFKRISELPVHNVADTVSVNNIRAVILTMAKPMAEISRNQMMNLQLIDRKIKEIEDCIREGDDLTGKLYVDQVGRISPVKSPPFHLFWDDFAITVIFRKFSIKLAKNYGEIFKYDLILSEIPLTLHHFKISVQIGLVPQELSHPMTVCAAEKCVEHKKMSSDPNAQTEICYTTVCHAPCALEGVTTEICPNPAIKSCYVFQTPGNLCKMCGCSWECHIHIRYKLDKTMKKVVDPAVEQCLNNCADHQEAAELFIKNEKERVGPFLSV